MSEEREKRELSAYERKAERALKDENRVNSILNNVTSKLHDVTKNNEKLQSFFRRIRVISRMVRAYVRGEYREVPWRSIVVLLAGLLYFLTPVDLIPDFIPVLGLLDDASMVAFIFNMLKVDIDAFIAWEEKRPLKI